jgi:hypothetical protein
MELQGEETRPRGTAPGQHCPHCGAPLAQPLPAGGGRCGSCRLVIGRGRALSTPQAAASSRAGARSGFLASEARRQGAAPVDPRVVAESLGRVARDLGVHIESLRLLDYQEALDRGHDGPSVAEIMATCHSWRAARAGAAAAMERLGAA